MKQARPGEPVEILGFDSVPDAGETVRVVESDREARHLAGERANRLKTEALARRSGAAVSLEDVFERVQQGQAVELNLVLKADVDGSLEAIQDQIAKLSHAEVALRVLHTGVGGISKSDVMLAAASGAVIIGFNVRPLPEARDARRPGGRRHPHLHRDLQDHRGAAGGDAGHARARGGRGVARHGRGAPDLPRLADRHDRRLLRHAGQDHARREGALVRDGTIVHDGRIGSLQRFKDDVSEVEEGFECGIVLENFQDIKEGDVLEAYETRKVERRARIASGRRGGRCRSWSLLTIHLHLPDNGSLKGKRKELLSVRAALTRRFGASVAEVGDQDLWQRATLAAGLVGGSAGGARARRGRHRALPARPVPGGRAGRAAARVVRRTSTLDREPRRACRLRKDSHRRGRTARGPNVRDV